MGVRLPVVLVVLAGSVLTSCVTVSVGPITATPTLGPSRAVSAGKGFGLIPDHNGQVVTVDADTDVIRLVLDDGWGWKVDVDPDFLRLQQYGPLQAQGFTAQFWLYKLVRTGETKVSATGTPNCRSASPACADADRLYSVTLRTR
jgi:hypothetical protein